MKNKKNILTIYIPLILIAVLTVLTGFCRDFIFKNINALLKAWDFDMDFNISPSLAFLENFEYDTLLEIKWILTFIFSILYLIISLLVIKLIFKKRKYLMITVGTYVGITFFSIIFMAIGHFFPGTSGKMYEFARYFMGMAQSPIILMILIPAFKLSEKENNKRTTT